MNTPDPVGEYAAVVEASAADVEAARITSGEAHVRADRALAKLRASIGNLSTDPKDYSA